MWKKKLRLLNIFLTAFRTASRRHLPVRNPGTTEVEVAEVTVNGRPVEIRRVTVSVAWADEERVIVSVPTPNGPVNIFRAEGNGNGRWWRIQASPAAWALGRWLQQTQAQTLATLPVAVAVEEVAYA